MSCRLHIIILFDTKIITAHVSFLTLSSKILSFHKICFHFLFKIYYSFALEEAENVLSPNCFRAECLQARHLAFETDTMTFTGVNSFRPGCLVR